MKLNTIKKHSHVYTLVCLLSLGCSGAIINAKKPKEDEKKVAIVDPSLTKEENKIVISLKQLIDLKEYPNKSFLQFIEEVDSTLKSNPVLKKKYKPAIDALQETKKEITSSKKKPNVIRVGKRFLKLKELLPKPVEIYFKNYLKSKKLLAIKNGKEVYDQRQIGRIANKRLKASTKK